MQVPPEEFILRLLQFLNNIYTKKSYSRWRGKNAVVIPVFKKVIKRPKKLQINYYS
jgi:hypothetical protein